MKTVLREVLTPPGSDNEAELRTRLAELNKERQALIAKCLDSEDEGMYDPQFKRILEEIGQIRQKLEGIQESRQEQTAAGERLEEIIERLKQLSLQEPGYDDVLVRKAIELIRVKSATELEITFRDGRTVTIGMNKF